MNKNRSILRALCLFLALSLSSAILASCKSGNSEETTLNAPNATTEAANGDTEETLPREFDYETADISQYITLSASDYSNTTVTLDDIYTITDEMVDEQLDSERFKHKTASNGDTKVTDKPIRFGDSAFIYYTGYLDGEAFSGGSNASSDTPYELSIGSGSFIPGFEEGLIGVVPNETSKENPFELHVSFPESYSNSPELAGKAVVFKVWVEYIIQYDLPELDDTFVYETLKFEGTAEEYRAYVKSAMQDQADEAKYNQTLSALTNLLLEKSTVISYPEESVNYWYEAYVSECKYYMNYYSSMGYPVGSLDEFANLFFGIEDGGDWKASVTEFAKATVHEKLVFYAVAQLEGITVAEDDIQASVDYFINYYKQQSGKTYTAQEIKDQLGDTYIRERALYTKVSDILVSNCTLEYSSDTE